MRNDYIASDKRRYSFIIILFALSLFIFSCGKTTNQKEFTSSDTLNTEVASNDTVSLKDVTLLEKEISTEKNEEKSVDSKKPESELKKKVQQKKVEKASPKEEKPKIPEIFFKEKVYKFGDIDQGDTVVHSFMFINSGNAPLYITDVDLSCGCTMSDYPKTAVKPRQSGNIELFFNSTHKEGSQRQYAIVSSNTIPGKDTLLIAGVVYRKMEDPEEDSNSN